jgi:hypothetical protein
VPSCTPIAFSSRSDQGLSSVKETAAFGSNVRIVAVVFAPL